MPWAKKNYDKISTLDNLAMVHPTIMSLPWTINMLHNPHANIIQEHKKMQQKIKRQCIQPTPMLEILMGHHLHWIMMVSNVAYVKGVLSTWHSTTPPNLHMFADLWWSKTTSTSCNENWMPSMWICSTSHHWCQTWRPIVIELENGLMLLNVQILMVNWT